MRPEAYGFTVFQPSETRPPWKPEKNTGRVYPYWRSPWFIKR